MNKIINPDFKETREQLDFRHTYMKRVNAAYYFHESLGVMDLGQDKKVSLQDIYVPLRYSEKKLDETRDWEDEEGTFSLLDVLDKYKHIVFSGKPGSGKTTLSRMLINLLSTRALTALSEKCGRRMPLYFKLRDYKIGDIFSADTLLDNFIKSQSKTLKFDISRKHLEFYLKKGWCFLIFDGVDEVGGLENRLKVRKFILRTFGNYNENNYLIVTSRPSGLENAPFNKYLNQEEEDQDTIDNIFIDKYIVNSLPFLKLFYIDSFNKSQANEFSSNWFSLREPNPDIVEKKSSEFLESIEKIKSLSVLKRRPVFLTMMAHIHTTKGKLPHSRASAYEYMVQAYVEHIDIARRLNKELYPQEEFIDWSFDDKIKLLQSIAYKFNTAKSDNDENDRALVVSKNQLLSIIKEIIEEYKESWQTIKEEHAESLLRFYLTRTGLLHEPEEEKVQFSHLSFQEFLAARFIYKKLIENIFQVSEIIKKEIIARLPYELFNKWSETILLFFSLNKEASNAILKAIIKDLESPSNDILKASENDEKKDNFYLLLLKIIESEEYGIKDSEMEYWVKKLFEYICSMELPERTGEFQEYNKAYELISSYFSPIERKQLKIDCANKVFTKLFEKYFEVLKQGNPAIVDKNKFENLLYSIFYEKSIAEKFKQELKNMLPAILNRKRFKYQFVSCAESIGFYFNEFYKPVYDFYTIDEAIIWRDITRCSVFSNFSKRDIKQDIKLILLEFEWIIEKLYIFSFLKCMDILIKSNRNVKEVFSKNSANLLILEELIYEGVPLKNKLWFSNIGLRYEWRLNHRVKGRKLDLNLKMIKINKILDVNIINKIIKIIVSSLSLKKSKTEFRWKELFALLTACALFSEGDMRFEKKYRKIENPFKNYNDMKEFYNLLLNHKNFYNHLLTLCSEPMDKKTFLTQYKEYDEKPYSMRNMVKVILDNGKENYPDFSDKEALELSIKLINQIADKEYNKIK
jgi:hypothetical protein